jgi:flagellar biosynthesis protein FlhG
MSTEGPREWLQSFKNTKLNKTKLETNIKNEFINETTTSNFEWHKLINQKSKIISVTGGKGGVGKTSIAIKLSQILAEKKNKVLLIDMDTNLSNTSIKLGIPLNNNFYSLLTNEKTFDECLYKDKNFHLLPACNGNIELLQKNINIAQIIIDIIYTHENQYDFIVIDCPAGLDKDSLILNAYSDKRVVVVTPDKSSITDSYSIVKVLNTMYNVKENDILVNQYKTQEQKNKVLKIMSETIDAFLDVKVNILGGIPFSEIISNNSDILVGNFGMCKNFDESFCKVFRQYTESSYRRLEI